MKLTGLYYFDEALERHPLFCVAHRSPIQSSCEITVSMTSQQVCRAIAVKSLQDAPYCIKQQIKVYRQEHSGYLQSPPIRLHRISTPNGQPLLWLLLTAQGNVLEQVFCKHKGKYPDYCRAIVRYLVHLTKDRVNARHVA